jgi:hypothetical protein
MKKRDYLSDSLKVKKQKRIPAAAVLSWKRSLMSQKTTKKTRIIPRKIKIPAAEMDATIEVLLLPC